MAKYGITNLARFVPLVKETTFGTKQTSGFNKLIMQSGNQIQITPNNLDISGDLTGNLEPIDQTRLTYSGSGNHTQRLLPQHARFIAFAMGDCTNTDLTNAYSHECVPSTNFELPSFTVVEDWGTINSSAVQYSYAGCVVDSFTISGQVNEPCQFSANILTCGKRETTSVTAPDVLLESFLRIGDVSFYEGGTITSPTATPTSATNYTASLQSFSYTFNNNVGGLKLNAGNQTGYANEALRTAITHSLSMRVYIESSAWITNFDADALQTIYIPILGDQIGSTAYYFGFKLMFPTVKLLSANLVDQDGLMAYDLTFQVLDPDGEYDAEGVTNSVHITSYDEQATYLSA